MTRRKIDTPDERVNPRMLKLYEDIELWKLKRKDLHSSEIFSQLDWKWSESIKWLQDELFTLDKPLSHSGEEVHLRSILSSWIKNRDILMNGGFWWSPDRKSLDFYQLCEYLFEETWFDSSVNQDVVNIVNQYN